MAEKISFRVKKFKMVKLECILGKYCSIFSYYWIVIKLPARVSSKCNNNFNNLPGNKNTLKCKFLDVYLHFWRWKCMQCININPQILSIFIKIFRTYSAVAQQPRSNYVHVYEMSIKLNFVFSKSKFWTENLNSNPIQVLIMSQKKVFAKKNCNQM